MEKKEIRKYVFKKRQEMTEEACQQKSARICQKIIEMEAFQKASCIYVYMDFNREVSTKLLIEEAWRLQKKVAAPKVFGEEMRYFIIHSYEEVKEGFFGVPEPTGEGEEAFVEDALMIVPGVGFDKNRHRCGYGKGFYDKYLSVHTKHPTIAAAFEFQIVDEVPVNPYDIFPQILVTEERILKKEEEGGHHMTQVEEIAKRAKEAGPVLARLRTEIKNEALQKAADALVKDMNIILEENKKDVLAAKERGMKEGLVDRLMLNEKRIKDMAEGLYQIASLDDPIGEVLSMKPRPNGLLIGQKRVPLGVVGIIYESRPNVTADAFGLCFKTGNAVILKGGSDAANSNKAIVRTIRKTLKEQGIIEDGVQLIEDNRRETVQQFMKLNKYIDVLIPRGGANLIRTVVETSTIPVIETGTGNCHIYVDETADIDMAIDIIFNAKTQRIGVCNACESLVVHEKVKDRLLPSLKKRLDEKQVELRGDTKVKEILTDIVEATEEDWGREYLDYILSIKTVSSIDEAIVHINRYNTGHSEAIITNDYQHAQKFLNEIDAAAVYVNASTRFTDGFEFGFGAEIGISTQKLHARGPMGLLALTTTKYIIYGNGQIRK